jgi:hypothetical protein
VIGTDFTGSWKSNYHTITASIVGKYFINTVFHIFLDDLDEKTRRNSDYECMLINMKENNISCYSVNTGVSM